MRSENRLDCNWDAKFLESGYTSDLKQVLEAESELSSSSSVLQKEEAFPVRVRGREAGTVSGSDFKVQSLLSDSPVAVEVETESEELDKSNPSFDASFDGNASEAGSSFHGFSLDEFRGTRHDHRKVFHREG